MMMRSNNTVLKRLLASRIQHLKSQRVSSYHASSYLNADALDMTDTFARRHSKCLCIYTKVSIVDAKPTGERGILFHDDDEDDLFMTYKRTRSRFLMHGDILFGKKTMMFAHRRRFSHHDDGSNFWEPVAPFFAETFYCLLFVFDSLFWTSFRNFLVCHLTVNSFLQFD